MACFGALVGYYSKDVNPSGRRSITFSKAKSLSGVPIMIPCGECIGCRMQERKQWAVRCLHEKRLHRQSAFVTLTYDDDHLPRGGSLSLRDLQLFMKRLRKARPIGLRFFACGEYGDTTRRPHYHVLLFNTDFPDMRPARMSPSGAQLYRSAELNQLWTVGDNLVGSVDNRSAAYVAGYVMKKVGSTEDYGDREPEFRVMSRRPGLGYGWFLRYMDEAYKADSVIVEGREVGIPRYYDNKFVKENPDRMKDLKRSRKREALFAHPEELTRERLLARERFELEKVKFFNRRGDGNG